MENYIMVKNGCSFAGAGGVVKEQVMLPWHHAFENSIAYFSIHPWLCYR